MSAVHSSPSGTSPTDRTLTCSSPTDRIDFYLARKFGLTSSADCGTLDSLSEILASIVIPKTYRGYEVKVVTHTKDTETFGYKPEEQDHWIGIWDFDKNLKGTIFLEKSYVEAVKKHNLESSLKETLDHETMEANLAKEKVFKKHGGQAKVKRLPYPKLKKLLDAAGAQTHKDTIEAMHPTWTEDDYLAALDDEMGELELD